MTFYGLYHATSLIGIGQTLCSFLRVLCSHKNFL